jgi:hypothetical protein
MAMAVAGGTWGAIGIGAADNARPNPPKSSAKIDPRADALLRKMSTFMARQQRFSVHTEGELEVVLDTGQKIEFPFESDVKVQRPNKLRADRRGANTDLEFLYDGRQLVLYGTIANMYAKAPAPKTIDGAIDHARDLLGIDAPGADLLYADSYAGLIPDVVSATYLGTEMVRGVSCEHAAFRGRDVDFQIWVREGSTATPCRYVVTTTGIDGRPEYSADLVSWNLSPRFEEDVFTFTPPPGAEQIAFLTPDEMRKQREARPTQSTRQSSNTPRKGNTP